MLRVIDVLHQKLVLHHWKFYKFNIIVVDFHLAWSGTRRFVEILEGCSHYKGGCGCGWLPLSIIYIYIYIYGVFIHSCLVQNFLMVVVDGGVGLQKCNLLLVKKLFLRGKVKCLLFMLALGCSVKVVASSTFSLDLGLDSSSLVMPYEHEQPPPRVVNHTV